MEEAEDDGESGLNGTSLHMATLAAVPVSRPEQFLGSRAALLAWHGHTEQWRQLEQACGTGTDYEAVVPTLSSAGCGGSGLAGTKQAYGGQDGLTGTVAHTCSGARL